MPDFQFDLSENISDHFQDVFLSKHRYLGAFGGRGSGKSDTFYRKYIVETFQPYYFKLAYINKEKANIRDQQYAGFKRVIKSLGLQDYFKCYDGDYRIVNNLTDNSMIPKGMDDPEKTKGMDEVTAIWWDEINKGSMQDFAALNDLLRTPKAEYLQFAFSFNPINEKHWIRNYFFDEKNGYKFKEYFATDGLLNHSTALHNDFIDGEAYQKVLIQNANGQQSVIDVNVHGRWGVIRKGDLFMYAFKDKHVNTIEEQHNPAQLVYLSFDFNVNPMTCIVGQHDLHLKKIRILKEYRMPDAGVYEICKKIKLDYPTSIFKITGDAAGYSRNTAAKGLNNNYTIIMQELRLNWSQVVAPRANPLHTVSRTNCNAMLNMHPDFLINPSCEFLINDLQNIQTNEAGGVLKVTGENGHLLDTFRYYINSFCDGFKKKI